MPYAMERSKGGGTKRQARHRPETGNPAGAISDSPHRWQAGPRATENSVQQELQIGAEERCGREEPQRAQRAGRIAEANASIGLRSTRTTARQREVSDGDRLRSREPELLRKTHLTGCAALRAALRFSIPARGRSIHTQERPGPRAEIFRLRPGALKSRTSSYWRPECE